MLNYENLDSGLVDRINSDRKNGWVNPYRCSNDACLRRNYRESDEPNLWRPAFVRDTEKIIHLPLYNRYADKTQVFSFRNNDDITRRALHVQLVSRIARNIGSVLGLNTDLIEAIALGHDIGHTPFGHAGEAYLSELLLESAGLYFNHNVHSVRVLDRMFMRNISLQTLDGALCHNGEFEMSEYKPQGGKTFTDFDRETELCYRDKDYIKKLVPMTLEGCVVRICDIIAYIGKDRQDAKIAGIVDNDFEFPKVGIGSFNADMTNNLTVDIISNSYGRNCIKLSSDAFTALSKAKSDNYGIIYNNAKTRENFDGDIKPMFAQMFERLLDDVRHHNTKSPIYRHHIEFVHENTKYYGDNPYENEPPEMIVADYIAAMTDDYFLALYRHLFPHSCHQVKYISYFD